MLATPNCYKRRCRHFLGVIQPDGTEMTEVHSCEAFPDGIPGEISYGRNKHLRPLKDQKNDLVYEEDMDGDGVLE
jgi:hypothetical protein